VILHRTLPLTKPASGTTFWLPVQTLWNGFRMNDARAEKENDPERADDAHVAELASTSGGSTTTASSSPSVALQLSSTASVAAGGVGSRMRNPAAGSASDSMSALATASWLAAAASTSGKANNVDAEEDVCADPTMRL
jgi:hypothetical protein